jgi:uncharacterized membrane protein YidH (DUF202 family)
MIAISTIVSSVCTNITGTDCSNGLPHAAANSSNVHRLLQVMFGILGALAVLMIVIGALNFINSEGDSQKAANARSVMIYSLVGLVIALSAEIIVSFVLGHF